MTCFGSKEIRCFVWPKGQSSSNVCENKLIHVSLQIPWEKTIQVVSSAFQYTGSLSVLKFTVEFFLKCTMSFWVPLRDIRPTNRFVKCLSILSSHLSFELKNNTPTCIAFPFKPSRFWHSFYGNVLIRTLIFRNLSVYKVWDYDSVGVRLSRLSIAQLHLHALVLSCHIHSI